MKKCNQTKCGYYIFGRGCRKCKECQAEPFVVSDDCDRCWNCEHDEGLLRWEDQNEIDKEEEREKVEEKQEKPLLVAKC